MKSTITVQMEVDLMIPLFRMVRLTLSGSMSNFKQATKTGHKTRLGTRLRISLYGFNITKFELPAELKNKWTINNDVCISKSIHFMLSLPIKL